MFHALTVRRDADRDAASDGEEQGLEALACQIEELIMCFIGSARLSPALSPLAGELAYSTGLCLQMTAEQAECWSEDPYAWLAEDMDDFKSARGVGEMLVSELAAVLGEPGVVACVDAHRHLLGDAQRFAAAGDARMCWIRREAALR